MTKEIILGVIGGSGLYEMDGLSDVSTIPVDTPFGKPPGEFTMGTLHGVQTIFTSRHGVGHRLLPHEINYRAMVYGLKKLGVTHAICSTAVGSWREGLTPGDLVLVDNFIDRTQGRASTFFGDGVAGHLQCADPGCSVLREHIWDVMADDQDLTIHSGATLCVINGPRFSYRGEAALFRDHADLVGMTAVPEDQLLGEAEIHHVHLALVTDMDCGESEADEHAVTAEEVGRVVQANAEKAKRVIAVVARSLQDPSDRDELLPATCGCATALDSAIMTDPAMFPEQHMPQMRPIFGRACQSWYAANAT